MTYMGHIEVILSDTFLGQMIDGPSQSIEKGPKTTGLRKYLRVEKRYFYHTPGSNRQLSQVTRANGHL